MTCNRTATGNFSKTAYLQDSLTSGVLTLLMSSRKYYLWKVKRENIFFSVRPERKWDGAHWNSFPFLEKLTAREEDMIVITSFDDHSLLNSKWWIDTLFIGATVVRRHDIVKALPGVPLHCSNKGFLIVTFSTSLFVLDQI